MMQYALLESGREVNALDISNGTLRSNNYNCICCGNTVTYVAGSYRSKPHFRHKNEESCIDYSKYSSIVQDANDRIENRKSKFHQDWQSLFSEEVTEVKLNENNKLHIADIFLQNSSPFQIVYENGIDIFSMSFNNLVIEIQHSHISLSDAKQREQFYCTDNRMLVWIVNISHIEHNVEQYITFTQDKIRILFPAKQHSGLSNIMRGCKKAVILLDNGSGTLFKITNACLDSGFTEILPVSKNSFLKQLNIQSKPTDTKSYIQVTRNYKDYISSIDECIIVDIDEIINMIEDIPISCLREGCQMYANNAYDTYVEMIVTWMGIISNRDLIVYKMLTIWINHIRKTHYSHDKLTFGKYKNISICDLPQHYVKWVLDEGIIKDEELENKLLELRMMDQWFVKHYFNNGSKLVHFKRCRDNYYRVHWDRRTSQDRLSVLQSILGRPWVNMIDDVIPDENGFVKTNNYLDLPSDSCEFEKRIDADSDDDNAYYYKYKPVNLQTRYIGISEEDLLYWYGVLDEQFGYDYHNKCLRSRKLEGYAFRDI